MCCSRNTLTGKKSDTGPNEEEPDPDTPDEDAADVFAESTDSLSVPAMKAAKT